MHIKWVFVRTFHTNIPTLLTVKENVNTGWPNVMKNFKCLAKLYKIAFLIILKRQSLKFNFLPSATEICASAVKFPADLWLLYFLHSGRCLVESIRCQGVLCGCHVLCCLTKILNWMNTELFRATHCMVKFQCLTMFSWTMKDFFKVNYSYNLQ